VGVDVHEAGGHQKAGGVDLLAPSVSDVPYRDYAAVLHGHIRRDRLKARAVDDRAAADHQADHVRSASIRGTNR
jgi:hypothetical protein